MPLHTVLIPPEMDGWKLRSAALGALHLSSGEFKRAKFHGQMTLDGVPVHADARVKAGQVLALFVPEAERELPQPAHIPLSIAYEDEHFWIIDKPAPLPTASSTRQEGPTLENALFAHLGQPQTFCYRPVNRLDKGTSGLMIAAKTANAQHQLQQMLHTDDFAREYLAVVEGAPEQDEGVIDLPIGKADGATVKREVRADGKEARTHFRVLQRGTRSLIRLRLETGRTHQIRVHMSALGCPVTGDFLYGWEIEELPGRFALHSAYVRLRHPFTGEWLERESELPPALQALVAENRQNS